MGLDKTGIRAGTLQRKKALPPAVRRELGRVTANGIRSTAAFLPNGSACCGARFRVVKMHPLARLSQWKTRSFGVIAGGGQSDWLRAADRVTRSRAPDGRGIAPGGGVAWSREEFRALGNSRRVGARTRILGCRRWRVG